ncbi:MAG: Crp/Fnr family transcriptional regulator [Opitutaceae bacterium]|nr:Crp/Fnr family transcriptional regulator [Opitutaceae bacterium]
MSTPTRLAQLKLTGLTGTLRGSQLFGNVPGPDLEEIAGFARPLSLSRGEYLFREGEPAQGCYVVASGAINVHRVSVAGKEQVIHIFRAGESFAEGALSSPTGYPANARSIQSSTVLLLPKQPLLDLIGRRPDLALRMLGSMGAHLRILVGMLDDLTLKDVETRLLNWLVKQRRTAGGADIRLPGTKRELAAELGTSSETLSRTLGRLRDSKIISIAARTITVHDRAALTAKLQHNLGGP